MIHVCYGLYDATGRYSKFTGTSILSMFENTRAEVTVHILHDDNLTDDNRDKFLYIAEKYNQLIKFYNVEKICADELQKLILLFSEHKAFHSYTIGAIFRLLITKLFADDIEKVIYLDSDTIVNLDISELWQAPIDDDPIAAVSESANGVDVSGCALCKFGLVNPEDYFNSGVLVINLDKLRGNEYENFQAGIKFIAENPQYNNTMDQDILNYCFSQNYLILPKRFNFFVRDSRWHNEFETENRILHYLAGSLQLDMRDTFNRLWFSYFEKTLWFNKEIIFNFYEELIKYDIHLKSLAIKTAAVVSGKKRVFFIEENTVAGIRPTFCVSDDEEVELIVFKGIQSIQALKESMKAAAGSKVYFILISAGYKFLRNELMKEGFTEGIDFIDAAQFLSKFQGVPLNEYNLIKAL